MTISCLLFKLNHSVSVVSLNMFQYLYLKIYKVNKLSCKVYKTQ